MNIVNNKYNQSFSGGFRFHNVSSEMKTQISELITKRGKQVFLDFEKQGDVFLVTRDKLDGVVAGFITKNKLPFEYYPQISTKSGLDSQCPEILSELLKINNFAPIKTVTQLKKVVHNKNKAQYIENKSSQYIENILKSLCVDNKHPIHTKKGVKIVVDNEFDRKILISPPSKYNIHYVVVQPNSPNKAMERYAIASDGIMLQAYKTPDSIKNFHKQFNSLLLKTE